MSTAKVPSGRGSSSACWPIHATMPSGVTRWANTTPGGAAMSMEVANSAISPGGLLRGGLEGGQVGRHHVETVAADAEQVPGPLPLLGHQPRAPQHPQVVGHGLL